MTNIERWGCPDWRDRGSYPETPDDLKDWEWRWQFMRRFPKYRELWGVLPRFPEGFDDDDSSRGYGLSSHQNEIRYSTNMQSLTNPNLDRIDYNPFRIELDGSLFYFPSRAYFEEFHEIWKPTEPDRMFYALLFYLEIAGILQDSGPMQIEHIRFDLSKPLEYQLKVAKQNLIHSRKSYEIAHPPKVHLWGETRNLWPLYLRLIDADDQGAKPMVIFRQFEEEGMEEIQEAANEAAKISDMIKAARKVQEKVIHYL